MSVEKAQPNPGETVELKILRQDRHDGPRRFESFSVALGESRSVLDGLREIAGLMVEGACDHGSCGACGMIINGDARLACQAPLGELAQPIEVRPLSKFKVVRDLVVDRGRILKDFARMAAGAKVEEGAALSPCIACGLCLEVCPSYGDHSPFVGAAAVHQAHLLNLTEPQRAKQRLAFLMEEGGLADCGHAQNCVWACPKDIPLTTSLAESMRGATLSLFKG